MKKYLLQILFCTLLAISSSGLLRADDSSGVSPTETKLREALKSAYLQIRTDQDQAVTLQAAKDSADQANKELQAKLDAMTQQLAEAKAAATSDHAAMNSQIIVLHRQIDDGVTRNLKLYDLATEILTRYEHFGLGDAITAKEPFVEVTRVKLENFVQEYQDKLSAQKIKPTSGDQTTAKQ